MRKFIPILSALALTGLTAFGQGATTATNFTATDCNGNSHTLFTDLDNGKVVVLEWVMPCGACVAATATTWNIVKTYDPAKVQMYLMDDLGDNDCASLTTFASAQGINTSASNFAILKNVNGQVIKEDDYGGTGMPHVVVLGNSTAHKIIFNGQNSAANNSTAIQNAINWAMVPASVAPNKASGRLTVYPNPATDNITIEYSTTTQAKVTIDVVNLIGKRVGSVSKTAVAGANSDKINTSNLPNGVYFVKLNVNGVIETMKFMVSK